MAVLRFDGTPNEVDTEFQPGVTFRTAMDASVAAGMTPDIYTCSIPVQGLARQSTPHKVQFGNSP